LKQRYTDFLVNEIGLDGQVLHLKSTQVEKKKKEVKAEAPAEAEIVKPEEKIEIVEDNGVVAAPVLAKEEKPAESEQPVKAVEACEGEETFAIAAVPKKEAKEEVRLPEMYVEQGAGLIVNRFPRRTQSYFTRFSVKTLLTRFCRSCRAYGTARKPKREALRL